MLVRYFKKASKKSKTLQVKLLQIREKNKAIKLNHARSHSDREALGVASHL